MQVVLSGYLKITGILQKVMELIQMQELPYSEQSPKFRKLVLQIFKVQEMISEKSLMGIVTVMKKRHGNL